MGTKLPRKLEQKMQIVGEQIKLARLRRNLSVAQVAERATCSPLTVSRIEKGAPTVAIGIYLRVLYALQLDDDILSLAKDDELGRALQDMNLPQRERASKCFHLYVSRWHYLVFRAGTEYIPKAEGKYPEDRINTRGRGTIGDAKIRHSGSLLAFIGI